MRRLPSGTLTAAGAGAPRLTPASTPIPECWDVAAEAVAAPPKTRAPTASATVVFFICLHLCCSPPAAFRRASVRSHGCPPEVVQRFFRAVSIIGNPVNGTRIPGSSVQYPAKIAQTA